MAKLTVPQRIARKLTATQRAAIVHLRNGGGSAVRMKWPRHSLVIIQGEVSHFMLATYKRLVTAGLCTYINNANVNITPLGCSVADALTAMDRVLYAAGPMEKRAFHPADFDRVDEGGGP